MCGCVCVGVCVCVCVCVCVYPPSPLPSENIPSQDSFRDDDQVTENMLAGVDPEEDSAHYMAILVESLSTLGRVTDALDVRYGLHVNMFDSQPFIIMCDIAKQNFFSILCLHK